MDPATARILDANGNRATEALRVIEDYVRFGHDDKSLAARLKNARHDLANALNTLDRPTLLDHRDTPGDVGTTIATTAEYHRPATADVVAAACKRLTQALRSLEEFAKTIDPAVARIFEQLRYTAYDLEAVTLRRLSRRQRLADACLYVLVTESLCSGPWLDTARAALTGGADILQLREKNLPDGELLARAKALTELAHEHNALCIINDRPDIARLSGADGVHLGQDDLTIPDARRIVGTNLLIGISTHSPDQIAHAASQRPDYIAIGPMFTTATKPDATRSPDRQALIRAALATTDNTTAHQPESTSTAAPETPTANRIQPANIPSVALIVAIGGITPENAPTLITDGIQCICACNAVIAAPDPATAAATLRRIAAAQS